MVLEKHIFAWMWVLRSWNCQDFLFPDDVANLWLILFFSPFFFSFLSFWTNKLGLVVWSWQRLLATFPSRWPTQWMASSNYYCHSCHSPCRSIFTSPRVNLSSLFAQTVYKLRKYQHYYKIKKQCPQKTKTKGEKKGGGGDGAPVTK